MTTTLPIAHTWDGVPLPAGDRSVAQLAFHPRGLSLRVAAPLRHDPPPPGPPGPTPGLWNHEVVECFVAGDGPAYLEVELGPHGHHLVLLLSDVRQPSRQGLPLTLLAKATGATWWATEVLLPTDWLPQGGALLANAYAIHGVDGDRRYLAHAPLPGPAPDFHQPGRFPEVERPDAPRALDEDLAAAWAALSGSSRDEAMAEAREAATSAASWCAGIVGLCERHHPDAR